MTAIRTLVWWNRGETLSAFFWNEAARGARVVCIDELGDACHVAVRPPAGSRMRSLLPPDLAWLAHGGDPARLAASLTRLLSGAHSPRVLVHGAIASPALFTAACQASRPDVIASGPGLPDAALSPLVAAWRRDFDEQTQGGRDPGQRLPIAEIASFGLHPIDPEAPLPVAWTGPERRACLLLPGHGGGAARLTLHLLGTKIPLDDEHVRLRLDGRDLECRFHTDSIAAATPDLPAAAFHRLEILQATTGPDHAGLALVAVQLARQ